MPAQIAADSKYYRDLGFTMSDDVRTQKGIEIPKADLSSMAKL